MWRVACGTLGMSLSTFNALTPRELQWRLEQAVEREYREMERTALLACWVMNPWLKKGQHLRAHDLIGPRPMRSDE